LQGRQEDQGMQPGKPKKTKKQLEKVEMSIEKKQKVAGRKYLGHRRRRKKNEMDIMATIRVFVGI